jgi:crotonobetainyl-CoA:carnitine CoA-transferase CaiB-like acyl-CoA transferase
VIYDGLRVVDLSAGIGSGYCSKLLTDLGADVVKLEPPDGDPLRAENPRLFDYLHTSQRSVVGDWQPWVAGADVVVESFRPGIAEEMGVLGIAPVTVSISSFGRGGPDSQRALPEEVLQARSGSLSVHGHMGRTPLTVGGHLGEYITGAFAALGAVTAWYRASRNRVPEHVDVSMFEAMQLTLAVVPTLMARFPGGIQRSFRWVMIPGNEPTNDGRYVGITTVTKQQWLSLLSCMCRDDLVGDEQLATMIGRFQRAKEVNELLRGWTGQHAADEIVELCAAARVPAAVVGNGELLPTFAQLVARDGFVDQPGASWRRPRAPFRCSGVADRVMTASPALGASSGDAPPTAPRPHEPAPGAAVGERPLAGVRVLDFTAFWSGPFATAWLASMGAEVIKVESVKHPDGIRFSAVVSPNDDPQYFEQSPVFHAANLGKKGITLELDEPDGLARTKELIAGVDVVAENFTPRVMDGFGLSYDEVRAINPTVVMLRLPAFGLTGPWRDRPGFAQTMEQLTGMAWVTGYEGGPPIIPAGLVDPTVGTHAAIALIAALDRRARTGEGQLIEMAMIEVAAAMTAEQVIEYSATGELIGRRGEGGVYQCTGDDQWVAVDRDADPMAPTDRAAWCATRAPEDAVRELGEAGIAAAAMVPAYTTLDDPQLRARHFFQPIEHPIVGMQEYPGWPVQLSGGPKPGEWWTGPAPTLGQHNDELLP